MDESIHVPIIILYSTTIFFNGHVLFYALFLKKFTIWYHACFICLRNFIFIKIENINKFIKKCVLLDWMELIFGSYQSNNAGPLQVFIKTRNIIRFPKKCVIIRLDEAHMFVPLIQ